jgi:hypothetical protein
MLDFFRFPQEQSHPRLGSQHPILFGQDGVLILFGLIVSLANGMADETKVATGTSSPDGHRRTPLLVGSTGDLYDGSILDTKYTDAASDAPTKKSMRADWGPAELETNHFKSAQW